jgi:putative acetyltransferase
VDSLPTNTMSIRSEVELDFPRIREVNSRAFGRDDEADLVDRLRADGDVIKSLVALQMGKVVGHILFSKLPIERGDRIIAAAALAPMAVDPDHQGQGIGSLLVMRGIDSMRRRDIAAIVVVGEPGYYERFGFRAALAAAIEAPYSGESFMALELEEGVLAAGGRARYPAAFAGLD